MTYPAWICEGCRRGQRFRDNIWDCPGCGKEGCDDCFELYGHCKACCVGKTEYELFVQALKAGFGLSATAFTVPRDSRYVMVGVDELGEVVLQDFDSLEECDAAIKTFNDLWWELEDQMTTRRSHASDVQ